MATREVPLKVSSQEKSALNTALTKSPHYRALIVGDAPYPRDRARQLIQELTQVGNGFHENVVKRFLFDRLVQGYHAHEPHVVRAGVAIHRWLPREHWKMSDAQTMLSVAQKVADANMQIDSESRLPYEEKNEIFQRRASVQRETIGKLNEHAQSVIDETGRRQSPKEKEQTIRDLLDRINQLHVQISRASEERKQENSAQYDLSNQHKTLQQEYSALERGTQHLQDAIDEAGEALDRKLLLPGHINKALEALGRRLPRSRR